MTVLDLLRRPYLIFAQCQETGRSWKQLEKSRFFILSEPTFVCIILGYYLNDGVALKQGWTFIFHNHGQQQYFFTYRSDQRWTWIIARISGWVKIFVTFWVVLHSMRVYQHIYDYSNQIHSPLVLHFATVWKNFHLFLLVLTKFNFGSADQIRNSISYQQVN
jgi:Na+/melibiose symporter-like transporter